VMEYSGWYVPSALFYGNGRGMGSFAADRLPSTTTACSLLPFAGMDLVTTIADILLGACHDAPYRYMRQRLLVLPCAAATTMRTRVSRSGALFIILRWTLFQGYYRPTGWRHSPPTVCWVVRPFYY